MELKKKTVMWGSFSHGLPKTSHRLEPGGIKSNTYAENFGNGWR